MLSLSSTHSLKHSLQSSSSFSLFSPLQFGFYLPALQNLTSSKINLQLSKSKDVSDISYSWVLLILYPLKLFFGIWHYFALIFETLCSHDRSQHHSSCAWTKYLFTWLPSRDPSFQQKLWKVSQSDRTKVQHKFRKINHSYLQVQICYQGFLPGPANVNRKR